MAEPPNKKPKLSTDVTNTCPLCGKTYAQKKTLSAHMKTHDTNPPHTCPNCGKSFTLPSALRDHMETHESTSATASSRAERPRLRLPESDPHSPQDVQEIADTIMEDGDDLSEMYVENWRHIRTQYNFHDRRRIMSEYNLRLPNSEISMPDFIRAIDDSNDTAYAINARLGYITFNVETAEFQYWWGGKTSRLFEDDVRIQTRADFDRFLADFEDMDLQEIARQRRPNTKCVIMMITNIQVIVVSFPDVPIQGLKEKLPLYIRNNKSIISLQTDRHNRRYSDELCFFRCLQYAELKGAPPDAEFEENAYAKFRKWLQFKRIDERDFKGMQISQIDDAEKLFHTPIYVYKLQPFVQPAEESEAEEDEIFVSDEDDHVKTSSTEKQQKVAEAKGEFTAVLVRRPLANSKNQNALRRDLQAKGVIKRNANPPNEPIFLNLYEKEDSGHFSYIRDFDQYAKCFTCSSCGKIDNHRGSSIRHEIKCKGAKQQNIFPGGGVCLPRNVFALLDDEWDTQLHLKRDLHFYPYHVAYDFESYNTNMDAQVFTSLQSAVPTLPLPAQDDQQPDAVSSQDAFLVSQWSRVKTTYNQTNGTYTIRSSNAEDIAEYVRTIAEQQTCRFELSVTLFLKNAKGKLSKLRMFSQNPVIFNPTTLASSLVLLDPQNIAAKVQHNTLVAVSVRLNFQKTDFLRRLNIASVAIATNVPGYVDEATNLPIPTYFVSDGDSRALVSKFLNHLNEISRRAEAVLRPKYSRVLERLEHRIVIHEDNIENIIGPLLDGDNAMPKTWYKQLQLCKDNQLSEETIAKLRHEKECWLRLTTVRYKLEHFLTHIPVLGFNSAKFDLNLVRKYLFPLLVKECDDAKMRLSVIRKDGGSYMSIESPRLTFLDMGNFLSAGCSYAQWIKAYKVELSKSHFPHDAFTSLEYLKIPYLVPREHFKNELKGEELSQEDYAHLQEVWKSHSMKTMGCLLKYYNELDTIPFVLAVEIMRKWYIGRGLDMLKGAFSLPGLALKDMLNHADPFTHIVLEQKTRHVDNSDIHDLISDNIVGGPALVFHRWHERDITTIREQEGFTRKCKNIVGYDQSALYLWATANRHCVGIGRRFRPSKLHPGMFSVESLYKYANSELQWLSWTQHVYNMEHPEDPITIRHKFNNGKSERVAGYYLDGCCHRKKIGYQFYGCNFHGCPHDKCKYKPKNMTDKLRERQATDRKIIEHLKAAGYTVITKQYCEWVEEKSQNPALKEFLEEYFELPPKNAHRATQKNLLKRIKNGDLFGVALVDIHVPPEKEKRFEEFCPIFKNVNLERDQIGEVMKAFAEDNDIMQRPRKTLVSSMFGKKILLATPLLQWYMKEENGLQVTKLYEVIEYKGRAVFKNFADEIVNARREADNGGDDIRAQIMKLLGNSCYGKTLTRIDRHRTVVLCNAQAARRHVKSPYFSQFDEIDNDFYEITLNKKKIIRKLPRLIGFMVYSYAKLRMLEFFYDFIDRFVPRDCYQLAFMDTDSLYMAIAGDSIEDLVPKERKAEFDRVKYNYIPNPALGKWDNRTPGLANKEYDHGEGYVALNSKTYYVWGTKDKRASKGLPKRNVVTKNDYLRVLRTRQPVSGLIKTFKRMKDGDMARVDIRRNSLTWFYPKREVMKNGVDTKFLRI